MVVIFGDVGGHNAAAIFEDDGIRRRGRHSQQDQRGDERYGTHTWILSSTVRWGRARSLLSDALSGTVGAMLRFLRLSPSLLLVLVCAEILSAAHAARAMQPQQNPPGGVRGFGDSNIAR